MRIAVFAFAVLVGAGAAEARQIEIISASPGRIEVAAWCWGAGSNCQQEASDLAQGYCHGKFEDTPRRASYVRAEQVEHSFAQERVVFIYRCDRRSITCQSGNC